MRTNLLNWCNLVSMQCSVLPRFGGKNLLVFSWFCEYLADFVNVYCCKNYLTNLVKSFGILVLDNRETQKFYTKCTAYQSSWTEQVKN